MEMLTFFLDGLDLLEGVWYFVTTDAKAQVFPEYPQQSFPEMKRGRPRKRPVLSYGHCSCVILQKDPYLQ